MRPTFVIGFAITAQRSPRFEWSMPGGRSLIRAVARRVADEGACLGVGSGADLLARDRVQKRRHGTECVVDADISWCVMVYVVTSTSAQSRLTIELCVPDRWPHESWFAVFGAGMTTTVTRVI